MLRVLAATTTLLHCAVCVLVEAPVLLSADQYAAMMHSATHRASSNVVDEPVPFHRLPSTLNQTVVGGKGVCAALGLPHPCELPLVFAPHDDLGALALGAELVAALDVGEGVRSVVDVGSGHLRLRLATVASPYRLSRAEFESVLEGEAGVDAHSAGGDDREARRVAAEKVWDRRVQARVQAMKKQLRDAAVLFGSNQHLRLQHVRLGREIGEPFVHLRYDAIGHYDLHLRGEWESVQTMLLQNLLQPGDVAVDVGSHIGTHTVALARAVGPRGVVHAFEVASPLLDVLQANVALAGLSNVLTYRAAVGSVAQSREQWRQSQRAQGLSDVVDSHAHFAIRIPVLDVLGPLTGGHGVVSVPGEKTRDTLGGAAGWVTRIQNPELSHVAANFAAFSVTDFRFPLPAVDGGTELVEIMDIDSFEWFLSPRTCPRLIKVDAEGMELSVLAGADTTVSVCRPALHLESNHGLDFHKRLLEHLYARNYTVYFEAPLTGYVPQNVYVGDGFHEAVHGPRSATSNLVAMPSEVLASLPQLARTWLSYLTRVDPARPSSVDYTDGIHTVYERASVVMSGPDGDFVDVTLSARGDIAILAVVGNLHA